MHTHIYLPPSSTEYYTILGWVTILLMGNVGQFLISYLAGWKVVRQQDDEEKGPRPLIHALVLNGILTLRTLTFVLFYIARQIEKMLFTPVASGLAYLMHEETPTD